MAIMERIVNAFNAFRSTSMDVPQATFNIGPSTSVMPYTPRRRYSNERTIISSIYTRLSIDISSVEFRHTKLDDRGRYSNDIKSMLSKCLTYEANLDQAPDAFKRDIAHTLFDRGVAVLVPVDTTRDAETNQIIDIFSLRVGYVTEWFPRHVRVSLYNEATGNRQDITLEKHSAAIVENPFFSVMNEPNSTLQRLIRKLNLLDVVDEQSGSGKLDLIIQLPYTIKSEAKRQAADKRRDDIEFQLKDSQYGIAYTDATEKITQLNRPAENNLLGQIEYLTKMLYSQLGLTEEILNGTADADVMNTYYARTIEPFLDAIIQAMQRSLLGMTKTDDNERVQYFRNPFKFMSISEFAKIVESLSRNEIIAPNEFRGYMGVPPSDDPKADKLQNSNMPLPTDTQL